MPELQSPGELSVKDILVSLAVFDGKYKRAEVDAAIAMREEIAEFDGNGRRFLINPLADPLKCHKSTLVDLQSFPPHKSKQLDLESMVSLVADCESDRG
jgi:hypothetical protein